MAITDLHIKDIYAGCLACSDIASLNINIVGNIIGNIEKMWGTDRPIFIDTPETYPSKLPRFLALMWVDGWPSGDVAQRDENGYEYDGYHLIVATFVDDISPMSLEKAQKVAFNHFDKNAKGWCY